MGKFKLLTDGPLEPKVQEVQEDEPKKEETIEEPPITHVQFFSRVVKLPSVESAISYAGSTYGRVKNFGPTVWQQTLTRAEENVKSLIHFTMSQSLPVVNKLQGPISSLDSLACSTLDTVTEKVPLITKKPDEIATIARTYVDETLKPFYERANKAVETLVNPAARWTVNAADSVVTQARSMVDLYIPATPDEVSIADEEQLEQHTSQRWTQPWRRCLSLITDVRRRIMFQVRSSWKIAVFEDSPVKSDSPNPFGSFLSMSVQMTRRFLGFSVNPIWYRRQFGVSALVSADHIHLMQEDGNLLQFGNGKLDTDSPTNAFQSEIVAKDDIEKVLLTLDSTASQYGADYPPLARTTHF